MIQTLTTGFYFSLLLVIHIRSKALAEVPDLDIDVEPCTTEGDSPSDIGDGDNGNSFETQDDMGEVLPVLKKSVVCYEFICYGENCLHGNITEGNSSVKTCTTTGLCYVYKKGTEYGLGVYAGCRSDCVIRDVDMPTDITTEYTNTEVPWISGSTILPKRRRKRSSNASTGICCNTALCNHDSPCGERLCEKQNINDLVCVQVSCTGEGCLYDFIFKAGFTFPTCTADENSVCYIRKEQTSEELSVSAGCGPPCDTNVDPGSSETPTTQLTEFEPRRRRATITNPRECCSTYLCNHDSPCGNLTCDQAMPVFSNTLVCYDIQCNGEGCLYAAITKAGSEVPRCYANGGHVCYVQEERSSVGVYFTAGCGLDCDISTNADQFVTSTVKGEPTSTNQNHLPPSRRRKRSETAASDRKCCKTDLCNHNSPCGSLACGAELTAFKNYSSVLILALFSLINQC